MAEEPAGTQYLVFEQRDDGSLRVVRDDDGEPVTFRARAPRDARREAASLDQPDGQPRTGTFFSCPAGFFTGESFTKELTPVVTAQEASIGGSRETTSNGTARVSA